MRLKVQFHWGRNLREISFFLKLRHRGRTG